MSLRPTPIVQHATLKPQVSNFLFSKYPILVEPIYDEISDCETDYGEDTDDINYYLEFNWYHRPRLGDNPNKVYRDHAWDEEWQEMEKRAEEVEDDNDDEYDQNEFLEFFG